MADPAIPRVITKDDLVGVQAKLEELRTDNKVRSDRTDAWIEEDRQEHKELREAIKKTAEQANGKLDLLGTAVTELKVATTGQTVQLTTLVKRSERDDKEEDDRKSATLQIQVSDHEKSNKFKTTIVGTLVAIITAVTTWFLHGATH